MIRFDFKKRKIRGWKRKVRKIEQWKNTYLELDQEALAKYNREYVKVWIAPFFSLQKHTIPLWYKRLVIQALLDIYSSWQQQLVKLDEPYYLKVWIFEKDFMWSQVVVSVRSALHFYDETFEELTPVSSLPNEFAVEAAKLLEWKKGFTAVTWFEGEMQEDIRDGLYTEEEIQAIKDSAYKVQEYKGEAMYLVKDDIVWVGKKAGASESVGSQS
ncbi:hypothetical protein [Enterococcus sp. BWR-S5]|uniref:hypothetical protein n=1 Tax=Enterococcus sp. BWR-S5 TaxID=2787714 RepID=UPI00192101AE|nr:hypothetical protein [Enterococcus sp. BWR-S5]MBL1224120.1 hypothetical protein [Enterococcus sp. BWR-S5]